MKKLLLVIFLILSGVISSYSQNDFEYGLLLKDFGSEENYHQTISKIISTRFSKVNNVHLFDWDETKHSVRNIEPSKEIKKPIRNIKLAQYNLSGFNLNPSIVEIVDTSGRTTSVYFDLKPGFELFSEYIDIKTSKIIASTKTNNFLTNNSSFMGNEPSLMSPSIPKTTNSDQIFVRDYLSYFGMDPAKLKKIDLELYKNKVVELTENYKPQFVKSYSITIKNYGDIIANYLIDFNQNTELKNFEIDKDSLPNLDNKYKYLTINASKKDSIKVNDYVLIYNVIDIDKYKTALFVENARVDFVGENSCRMKLMGNGYHKELTELLKNNAKIIIFTDENQVLNYNKKLNNNNEMYNVGIKKGCVFCNVQIEQALLRLPIVNLLERNVPELNYFQNLAKSDKFIDYNAEELLNKELGIKYLFYYESDNLTATDIETGRIIGSEATKRSKIYSPTTAKSLMLNVFNKDIKFLKVNEESKDKVKEIMIYCDFGFIAGERLKIYAVEDEMVMGKTIKRNREIGSGVLRNLLSQFVAVIKVKDGEKEIFEALNNKKELKFEFKID